METRACVSSPIISSSSAVARVSSMVSGVVFELFCAISASIFALACSTLGAVAGAVGGLRTQSGFLHGTIIGTLIGFTLSTEISAFLYASLHSDDFAIGLFVPLIETTSSILKERLDQHRLNSIPVVPEEVQVNNVETAGNQPYRVHGSRASITDQADKIPRISLSARNIVDTLWNGGSCTVCLQDFQLGETISCLPRCHHTFHSSCIARWFVGHRSCPLCRTNL